MTVALEEAGDLGGTHGLMVRQRLPVGVPGWHLVLLLSHRAVWP